MRGAYTDVKAWKVNLAKIDACSSWLFESFGIYERVL